MQHASLEQLSGSVALLVNRRTLIIPRGRLRRR